MNQQNQIDILNRKHEAEKARIEIESQKALQKFMLEQQEDQMKKNLEAQNQKIMLEQQQEQLRIQLEE